MTVRATFSEHDSEPVRGLPALLPPGERVLWQGAPDWRSLALHAYRLRELSVYFVLIVAARAAYLLASGATLETAVRGCLGPVVFSLISLGLLAAVAVFAARSTVYTITTRRVVVRQAVLEEQHPANPHGGAVHVERDAGAGRKASEPFGGEKPGESVLPFVTMPLNMRAIIRMTNGTFMSGGKPSIENSIDFAR